MTPNVATSKQTQHIAPAKSCRPYMRQAKNEGISAPSRAFFLALIRDRCHSLPFPG
jgi:hypothetical protein